jgi:hypothetical protein
MAHVTTAGTWFSDAAQYDANLFSNAAVTGKRMRIGPTALGAGAATPAPFSLSAEAGQVTAIVKGQASQTGNLQQWQTNTGTVLAAVSNVGAVTGRAVALTAGSVGDTAIFVQGFASQTTALSIIKGGASQTGDLQQWQNNAGTVLTTISSSGVLATQAIGAAPGSGAVGNASYIGFGSYSNTGNTNGMSVWANGVANTPLAIMATASQTAPLTSWYDGTPVRLFSVEAGGRMKWASTNEQTTVGTTGTASALPALPTRYLKVLGSDGVALVVPAYAAA